MSNKIVDIHYFNIDDKKENSILKNSKHQDNEIMESLNNLEDMTKKLEKDILNKNTTNNVITPNFQNKKN